MLEKRKFEYGLQENGVGRHFSTNSERYPTIESWTLKMGFEGFFTKYEILYCMMKLAVDHISYSNSIRVSHLPYFFQTLALTVIV